MTSCLGNVVPMVERVKVGLDSDDDSSLDSTDDDSFSSQDVDTFNHCNHHHYCHHHGGGGGVDIDALNDIEHDTTMEDAYGGLDDKNDYFQRPLSPPSVVPKVHELNTARVRQYLQDNAENCSTLATTPTDASAPTITSASTLTTPAAGGSSSTTTVVNTNAMYDTVNDTSCVAHFNALASPPPLVPTLCTLSSKPIYDRQYTKSIDISRRYPTPSSQSIFTPPPPTTTSSSSSSSLPMALSYETFRSTCNHYHSPISYLH